MVYGGCGNHRFGLFDMVLIKNNHLEAAGGVRAAMDRVKARATHYIKVEVEVESEADLREAIACKADVIMLDNQDLDSLRGLAQLARSLRPGVVLEASGNVSLSQRPRGGRDRCGPHLHQRAHDGGAPGGPGPDAHDGWLKAAQKGDRHAARGGCRQHADPCRAVRGQGAQRKLALRHRTREDRG